MAKKYNIELAFTANTQQVKRDLETLKTTLSNITNFSNIDLTKKSLTKELIEASNAAAQLKTQLEKATDVNTGKLNLKSLSKSLKDSGMTLQDYRIKLQAIGPEGAAAFSQLTNSILTANASIKNTKSLVGELGKSIKNVLTWNISSSILNMFTSSIREAFGYAEDLNRSLIDIGIVTGKNSEQLAQFAKIANKTAKELSTSTKKYADASLIYFQQGLSDEEVKKRTDLTVKMASVTGEAAEDVSSYMTAIWNNFAVDGEENLQRYADIITALGAATASSTDEIAGGLEKFAAIANTIGLSYEYATAALATVVSETRQSEETVGTAFKTIFGRFQSLSLGETLEDGTNLTKYTQALATVGVNVKDSNGELKEMNQIVDELGMRWQTLSDDQKVALANTVAGTRQYSNLIALLDNYEEFKINVDIATNAEGTLEDQFMMYEKSWQGATNRMKAAAESIYDSLIDDDAMIEMMDFFTDALEVVEVLLKSLGGIPGILSVISSIVLKTFTPQVSNTVNTVLTGAKNLVMHPVKSVKGDLMPEEEKLRKEALNQSMLSTSSTNMVQKQQSMLGDGETSGLQRVGALQQKLYDISKNLTEENAQQAALILDRQRALEKEYDILQDTYKLQVKQNKEATTSLLDTDQDIKKDNRQNANKREKVKALEKTVSEVGSMSIPERTDGGQKSTYIQHNVLNKYQALGKTEGISVDIQQEIEQRIAELQSETSNLLDKSGEDFNQSIKKYIESFEEIKAKIINNAMAEIEAKKAEIGEDVSVTAWEDPEKAVFQSTDQESGNTVAPDNISTALQNAQTNISSKAEETQQLVTAREELDKYLQINEALEGTLSNNIQNNQAFMKSLKEIAKIKGLDKNLVSEMEKLANETELSEDEVKALAESISRKLNDAAKTSSKQLETMKQDVHELGQEMDNVEGADALANTAEQMGVVSAQSKIMQANVEQSAQNGLQQYNNMKNGAVSVGQVITGIGTAATNAAFTFQSLQGMFSIWNDEDVEIGDKILSTFTTLGTMLPTMISSYKGLTSSLSAYTKQKKIEAQNAYQAAIATGTDTAAKKLHTKSILANTFAALTNPYMIAAALAAAAIGMAVYAKITANQAEEEERLTKKLEANTKAAKENLEANQDQLETLSSLTEQYDELNKKMDESAESAEELYSTYLSLKEVLGDKLPTYSKEQLIGNKEYRDEVAKVGQEALLKKQEDVYNSARNVVNSSRDQIANVFKEGQIVDYGAARQDGEDEFIRRLMTTTAGKTLFDVDEDSNGNNKALIVKKGISAEDYASAIKELKKYLQDQTDDVIDGNEVYETLMGYVTDSQDFVNDIDENLGLIEDTKFDAVLSATGGGKVSSISDYAKWYDKGLADARQRTGLPEEEVIKWFNSQIAADPTLNKFANDKTVLENIAKASGLSFGEILEKYEHFSPEKRTALMGVNIELVKTEGLETAIEQVLEKNLDQEITTYLEENKISQEVFDFYLKNLKKTWPELNENNILLKEAAVYSVQLSNGLSALSEAWNKNAKTLTTSATGTWEYIKAVEAIAPALEKAIGIDLSYDWYNNKDNMILLNRVLSGQTEHLPELQSSWGQDIINQQENLTDIQKRTLQAYFNDPNNKTSQAMIERYLKNDIISEDLFKMIGNAYGKTITLSTINKGSIEDVYNNNNNIEKTIANFSEQYKDTEPLKKYEIQVKQIEKELDKLSESKDKAFGTNRIAAIEAEKNATQSYINFLKNTYIPELANETTRAKKELEQFAKNMGLNVLYDETGNIINREEISGVIGGTDFLKSYESALGKEIEQIDLSEELTNVLSGYDIEILDLKLEYRSMISDEQKENLEYQLSLYEDNMDKVAERMAILGSETRVVQDSIGSGMQEINTILEQYGLNIEDIYGKTSEELNALNIDPEDITKIQDRINSLREDMTEFNELRKSMGEELTNYFDYIVEEFGEGVDKIEALQGFIQNYQDLIDSTGKKILGISNFAILQLNQASQQLSQDSLKTTKNQYDSLLKIQKETEEKLQKAIYEGASEQTIKYWQDNLENINAEVDEAKSLLLETWQTALETAADIFNQEVELAIEEMENTLSGTFGNLSYLQNAYSQQKTLSKQYLDDYQQAYELSKLMRNINNSITDTQNIKGKQLLKELQEEITELEEQGKKINEYDLQVLQKQYDVRLAQIALEEAQNAKTQVRLQQSADGGLSYIYTANQNDLDAAQQNYEDKMYELQKINANYIDSVSNDLISLIQDYMSKMQELASDTTILPEQKLARSSELLQYLISQANYLGDSFNNVLTNSGMNFSETLLGQLLPDYNSIDAYLNALVQEANNMQSSFTTGLNTYKNSINTINALAGLEEGETLEMFLNNEISDTNGLVEKSNQAVEQAHNLGIQLTSTYSNLAEHMSEFYKEFDNVAKSLSAGTEVAIGSFQKLLQSLTGLSFSFDYEFTQNGEPIFSGDTGGYTGSWGSSGKLAVLHEKELVLNASDTENMLKALDITRSLGNILNQASAKAFALSPDYLGLNQIKNETLDQNVSIVAEFPNATNHFEIEQAFENIINMASQYANRK